MVTDFSAAEKARGVKFCTRVGLLSGQVFSPFGEHWLAGSHGGGSIASMINDSVRSTASEHGMGIRNWRRRRCLRLYGWICVLQACWRTCYFLNNSIKNWRIIITFTTWNREKIPHRKVKIYLPHMSNMATVSWKIKNIISRFEHSQLQLDKFSERDFFTDNKIVYCVSRKNSQNDLCYLASDSQAVRHQSSSAHAPHVQLVRMLW